MSGEKKMSSVFQASIFHENAPKSLITAFLSQAAKCHLIPSIYHSQQSPAPVRVTSSPTELTTGVKKNLPIIYQPVVEGERVSQPFVTTDLISEATPSALTAT